MLELLKCARIFHGKTQSMTEGREGRSSETIIKIYYDRDTTAAAAVMPVNAIVVWSTGTLWKTYR